MLAGSPHREGYSSQSVMMMMMKTEGEGVQLENKWWSAVEEK